MAQPLIIKEPLIKAGFDHLNPNIYGFLPAGGGEKPINQRFLKYSDGGSQMKIVSWNVNGLVYCLDEI